MATLEDSRWHAGIGDPPLPGWSAQRQALQQAFIVALAASFHRVDGLLSKPWFGLRSNGWFELGGFATLSLGALWAKGRLAVA